MATFRFESYNQTSTNWKTQLITNILKIGPVPNHMAFIMDGNRRYAIRTDQQKSVGHFQGYGKLESVVEWCSEIGVSAISVYAFSIENFKRNADEVEYLMKLAERKADYLYENKESLSKHKICLVFTGNLSLLPSSLSQRCVELMEITKDNSGFICNICLSYTSSEEMAAVANYIRDGVIARNINPADITVELVDQCLNTSPMGRQLPPVDVIVRTSGEVRLSDFQLWQSAFAMFAFVDTLWPDFSLFDFARVIVKYKWHYLSLQQAVQTYQNTRNDNSLNAIQQKIVIDFCRQRIPSNCDQQQEQQSPCSS